MGQSQRKTRFAHLLAQRQSLLEREGHGLVDHHMETRLQSAHGRFVMKLVGGDDGHEVHALALGQRGLLLQHLLPSGIYAVVGNVIRSARAQGNFRINAEASANEFDLVLHKRGATVDSPDEGIAAAADHSHSKFSVFHDRYKLAVVIHNSNILSIIRKAKPEGSR